jgi:threonine/homoserine/homoserine lactone efflux protein
MAWNLLGLKIGEIGGAERPMKLFEAALFQWINPKAWAMGISFVSAYVVFGEERFLSLLFLTFGVFAMSPLSTITWMVFGKQLQVVLKKTNMERFLGIILAILMIIAVIMFLV